MDLIIYAVIVFVIIHFVGNVIAAMEADDDPTKDINEHIKRKQVAYVKVTIENYNNCWYGYYHPTEGGELFVAQGNTFEEAAENCRLRLTDKNARFDFKLEFVKK